MAYIVNYKLLTKVNLVEHEIGGNPNDFGNYQIWVDIIGQRKQK